jgi:hypothetical protein
LGAELRFSCAIDVDVCAAQVLRRITFFHIGENIMKKFTLSLALLACLFVTVNAAAETVIVGFEGCTPLDNYSSRPTCNDYWAYGFPPDDCYSNIEEGTDSWGDEIYIVTYSSKDTTFKVYYGDYYNYQEEYTGSFWGGIGLSTKSAKTGTSWYDDGEGHYDGDDLLSVTGSGYNSPTYGVVFGNSDLIQYWFDDLPSIILPENAQLQSIMIANTQWTNEYLNASILENIYLDLIIYGIGKNENGVKVKITEQTVRLSNLTGWTQISFGAGWENVTELRFAFASNDKNGEGLLPPVYFAFDDLTFNLTEEITEEITEETVSAP